MATCRMQTASRTASTASWAASVRVVQPRCATAARAATLTRQTRRSASHASQASTSRCRACRDATNVHRVRTVRRAQARICFVQRAASVARRRQRVRTTARLVLPVHRAPPGRRSPPRVRRVRSHRRTAQASAKLVLRARSKRRPARPHALRALPEATACHARPLRLRKGRRTGLSGRPGRLDGAWAVGDRGVGDAG